MKSIRVLFVCTGNVYRSMTAEKCLKEYVSRKKIRGIKTNSAGTIAKPEPIFKEVKKRLKQHKVRILHHRNKKISQKLIDNADIIVAMNKDHKEFIKEKFRKNAFLFNEIAYGKRTGIKDMNEFNPRFAGRKNLEDYKQKKIVEELNSYADFTTDYIYAAMPSFVDRLHKFMK